jgi:hypothetical protein
MHFQYRSSSKKAQSLNFNWPRVSPAQIRDVEGAQAHNFTARVNTPNLRSFLWAF